VDRDVELCADTAMRLTFQNDFFANDDDDGGGDESMEFMFARSYGYKQSRAC